MKKLAEVELSGFGKFPKAVCQVSRPLNIDEIRGYLNESSVTPRGLGRSYGDAALNEKGIVTESVLMNRFLSFDESRGIVKCEAGVTYKDLLDTFVLKGWFPPVTPGTKYVTIGGAIASDVHGKNHHIDGSISNFVKSFKILSASGEILKCSRTQNSDLFWATVGGMGLTGFITEAEIQLKKVDSQYINNKTLKLHNIDELFEKFEEFNEDYLYSVAWLDTVASGSKYGRNILYLGNHSSYNKLPEKFKNKSRERFIEKKIAVPFEIPFATLNKLSVTMFNAAIYMKEKNVEDYLHYDKYFYPLDFILNWNHIYSKNGLIQYQLNVPEEEGKEAIDKILKKVVAYGGGSFLAVLKKMGDQNGILSFPFKGYTLSMDFPVRKGVIQMCKQLDAIVLDYDGRTYLTKDSILDETTFKKMYDGLWQKWLEIKIKYDPYYKFSSNLGRRIGLCPS
ncbi:MAG: FAD-binding oxidoreductase [Chlorobi bacterium]|nr:FAD-binding oxidoreductase [Chlorobiota bacterium]MCI0715669.1 FAD-binding oxidoreductase [Chlorobiota bacterium]